MTISEILSAVAAVAGDYSESSFRRDIGRLKIRPVGIPRQKPQQFAPSVPAAILTMRGYQTALLPMSPLAPLDTAAARVAKLSSMSQLRNERKKARAK